MGSIPKIRIPRIVWFGYREPQGARAPRIHVTHFAQQGDDNPIRLQNVPQAMRPLSLFQSGAAVAPVKVGDLTPTSAPAFEFAPVLMPLPLISKVVANIRLWWAQNVTIPYWVKRMDASKLAAVIDRHPRLLSVVIAQMTAAAKWWPGAASELQHLAVLKPQFISEVIAGLVEVAKAKSRGVHQLEDLIEDLPDHAPKVIAGLAEVAKVQDGGVALLETLAATGSPFAPQSRAALIVAAMVSQAAARALDRLRDAERSQQPAVKRVESAPVRLAVAPMVPEAAAEPVATVAVASEPAYQVPAPVAEPLGKARVATIPELADVVLDNMRQFEERMDALESLRTMGESAKPALITIIQSDLDFRILARAIVALGEVCWPVEIMPHLIALAGIESPNWSARAMVTAGRRLLIRMREDIELASNLNIHHGNRKLAAQDSGLTYSVVLARIRDALPSSPLLKYQEIKGRPGRRPKPTQSLDLDAQHAPQQGPVIHPEHPKVARPSAELERSLVDLEVQLNVEGWLVSRTHLASIMAKFWGVPRDAIFQQLPSPWKFGDVQVVDPDTLRMSSACHNFRINTYQLRRSAVTHIDSAGKRTVEYVVVRERVNNLSRVRTHTRW